VAVVAGREEQERSTEATPNAAHRAETASSAGRSSSSSSKDKKTRAADTRREERRREDEERSREREHRCGAAFSQRLKQAAVGGAFTPPLSCIATCVAVRC
jgi:hypothetical protein